MKNGLLFAVALVTTGIVSFGAGVHVDHRSSVDAIETAVMRMKAATPDHADWGTFYTYYVGESAGTTDALVGVAVIKPGQEIHPPHTHLEEELLMVTEGQGTWFLQDSTFAASTGDILYSAPWDEHGIRNTGEEPLTFVVFKWNGKTAD